MSIQNLFNPGTNIISSQYLPPGNSGDTTLSDILQNGNDAGGSNITNVNYIMPNAVIFNNGSNNSHQLFQDNNICYLNFYPNSNSFQQGIVFNPNSNTLTFLANNNSPILKVGSSGGTIYDSVYNLPPNMQPAYSSYFQNFNLTAGNINLVPITNNTLPTSTVFLGLYNFTSILSLFPDCNHFKLTINSVELYSITGAEPGAVNLQFFLTDVIPFSSITMNDLSKNLSFPSASLNYTNGNSSTISNLSMIDFYSNTPQNLNLVISINSNDIGDLHLNRMFLNMTMVADDGEYNFLSTIST